MACTTNQIYKYVCVIEVGVGIKPIYIPVSVPAEEPEFPLDIDDHYYVQVLKAHRNLVEFPGFYSESGSAYLRIKTFPLLTNFPIKIDENEITYVRACTEDVVINVPVNNRRNLEEG